MTFIRRTYTDPRSFDLDAGGSIRISQRTTLGDYKFLRDKLPLLFSILGTGTNTFSSNLVQLSVAAGQYVVAQSKQFHAYLSGKSQLVEITFDNFHAQANVTKRVGYFSSSVVAPYSATLDGIFLQNNGTTVSIEVHKSGTVTTSVPQASFNDPLNGTGISGLTVDWQNFNVIAFDFLYLGGTAIRFFIFGNGMWNLFHTYNYAGTVQGTMIKSPNQPVRYEIVSTGAGVGTFNMICSGVSSEGSIDNVGLDRSVNNGATGFTAATIGTTYAVIGIRKGTTFKDAIAILDRVQIYVSTADSVRVDVLLNPTVAGVFTYAAVANSYIEKANGAATNTVTGGTALPASFQFQDNIYQFDAKSLLSQLGSTVGGVMDTIVLCVTPLSTNATVIGVVNYKEII